MSIAEIWDNMTLDEKRGVILQAYPYITIQNWVSYEYIIGVKWDDLNTIQYTVCKYMIENVLKNNINV